MANVSNLPPAINIGSLPPGSTVRVGGMPMGSSMLPWQPGSYVSTTTPTPPAPCPFSHDDVAALKALAAPLRAVIGAPHEPVADPATLATHILRLELIAKKIDAVITLHGGA